ncbi:ATP-binding cassette domain-containing protein [Candidatus Parcubacteria bacterium]|nr:ATP-binding cassette domain-containing protein [Candidatus Parcubacteria bacterium]
MFFTVKNLKVSSKGKEILKGVDLEMKKGELQTILGPNGSGKSVLVQTIMGNPKYQIESGKILLKNKDITKLSSFSRAKLGIALSWQNPPAIKGVKLSQLLEKIAKSKTSKIKITGLLNREVNLNYSGGEKKLSELRQILSLKPKLVILDEIDAGLDLKKTEEVAKIIKEELVAKNITVLLITHSGEILKFLQPEIVNVMVKGRIICRHKGYKKVLKTIKDYGYERCKKHALFTD